MSLRDFRNYTLAFAISLVPVVSATKSFAASKPAKIEINANNGVFVPLGKKYLFDKKKVYCHLETNKKYSPGFLTTSKGKKIWNSIQSWIKAQKKKHKNVSNQERRAKTVGKQCAVAARQCKPTVQSASITVIENTPIEFSLTKNDPCELSLETISINSPTHGSVEISPTTIRYTPDNHSLLSDSMSVAVKNPLYQSAPATINFVVNKLSEQFAGNKNSLLPYRETLTADETMSVLKKIGLGGTSELWGIRSTSELADALLDSTETSGEQDRFQNINFERLMRSANLASPDSRWFYNDIMNVATNRFRYGRPFLSWMGLVFWNNHFSTDVSGWSNSDNHIAMIEHVNVLRENALGNFRTFVYELFHDLPFQEYLGNFSNTITNPNQNFPREFLELFTAGTKDPITHKANYGEDEVVASTRYLAGWGYNGMVYGGRKFQTGTIPTPTNVRATDGDPYFTIGSTDCEVLTANKITVSWDALYGAYTFRVERRVHGTSTFTQIASNIGGWKNWFYDAAGCGSASPPSPGVIYDYRVIGVNYNGTIVSSPSNFDSGYFGSPSGIPAAPATTTASSGTYSNKVEIQWTAVSGATGYRVYRSNYDGSRTDVLISGDLPPNQLVFNDTGVLPGVVHMYYVRTIASNGALSARAGHGSEEVDVVFGFSYQQPNGLHMTERLTVSEFTDTSGVNLSWNAVSGAVGYKVFRCVNWNGVYSLVGSSSTNSFADTTAAPGTYYEYVVLPVDSDGMLGEMPSGSRFNPVNWAVSQNNLQPKPFLASLPDDDPNVGGRILGQVVNGVPQGQALSAFGQAFGTDTVPSFVDHVLYNWPATRRTIAAKLFAQIVHRDLTEAIVNEIGNDLIANNYDLKPVLRKLITSSAMFAPEANGTCVANPTEILTSFMRLGEIPQESGSTRNYIQTALYGAGHDVTAPPSVFGFKDCGLVRAGDIQDGSAWIQSTQTYVSVGNGIAGVLAAVNWPGGENVDISNFFVPSSVTTPGQLVDRTASLFNVKLNSTQRQILIDYLNKNDAGATSPWNKNQKDRLSGLIRMIVMSVQFLKK